MASVLLQGLVGVQALTQLNAGGVQAENYRAQAEGSKINARLERLEGKRTAEIINRELDQALSTQNALTTARNLIAGHGTSQVARNEAHKGASRDIDIARFGAELGASSANARSANLRGSAGFARLAGIGRAGASLATGINLGGS